MKIYLLEKKSYYQDSTMVEHQMADGGLLPNLFISKSKALIAAHYTSEYYQRTFGYEVIIPSLNNPRVEGNCLYACRLLDKRNNVRLEISVYLTYTND